MNVNCKENVKNNNTINHTVYESTDECHNKIVIVLENDKQYKAKITSDIPIYEGVEFAGYYQKGSSFLTLSGLHGDPLTLKLVEDYYILVDEPEDQAITNGWKLKIKESQK